VKVVIEKRGDIVVWELNPGTVVSERIEMYVSEENVDALLRRLRVLLLMTQRK